MERPISILILAVAGLIWLTGHWHFSNAKLILRRRGINVSNYVPFALLRAVQNNKQSLPEAMAAFKKGIISFILAPMIIVLIGVVGKIASKF